MQKHSLAVTKRTVFGKKAKKIRRDGMLPANIYGKSISSLAVQVPLKDFENVYKETGETGLIELTIEGEKRPVLIHNVQYDFVHHQPVHADFYQVNLKEKVKTMVPIVLVGEPKAVEEKLGLLLQTLNEIEVEALPTELPEKIEVTVTQLAAIGDQVTVGDLKKITGVEFLTDASQIVAKISELVTKEAEEQAKEEAAKAEEAKTEGEETPAEETLPTEEKEAPEQEKPEENKKEN